MQEPSEEQQLKWLKDDIKRRQYGKPPQKANDLVSALMARHGYAQQRSNEEMQKAWLAAAGKRLAELCRIGNVRRNVLEVLVGNSTVMQELTFQKRRILKKLNSTAVGEKVKDIRFRVGAVD